MQPGLSGKGVQTDSSDSEHSIDTIHSTHTLPRSFGTHLTAPHHVSREGLSCGRDGQCQTRFSGTKQSLSCLIQRRAGPESQLVRYRESESMYRHALSHKLSLTHTHTHTHASSTCWRPAQMSLGLPRAGGLLTFPDQT
jgi:hypothetical protein